MAAPAESAQRRVMEAATLTQADRATLATLLRDTTAADRFPLSHTERQCDDR